MRNLKVGIGDIRLLAYRADGRALIALIVDTPTNRVRVFPLPDGIGKRSVDVSNSTTVAVSPDGRRIAHISFGLLKIWDDDTVVQPSFRPWPGAGHLSGIAFTADGAQLLITGNSSPENRVLRRLMAWDIAAADEAWHLDGVNGTQVACAPDGLIAVAGQVGVVERDDRPGVTFVRDGEVIDRHRFPRDVARVRFSPDGTRLALARGPTVHVWDPATGDEVCRLSGHRRPVRDVAFSPDGRRLATAAEDEKVTFWDAATGRAESSFAWRVGVIGAVAFSPDGLTCAAGGSTGRVVVWDVDE